MAYQTPITIKTALERIRSRDYILPAIQREFVWRPDQICGLFDSLMQGYPIGSFLFWEVKPERSEDYRWYGVIKDYHQWKARHCPTIDIPRQHVVAILDGQQRLTSLNIGLRGSHAEKLPRKHYDNPAAYPTKHLYLNVCSVAPENEMGLRYDFRFLTPEQAEQRRDSDHHYFKVSEVYEFESGKQVHRALQQVDLGNHDNAYDILYDLWAVVHEKPLIPFFEETEQSLDKVLNIFIRVNSGGTPLSHSDLLLSIATAQWKDIDAREVIHDLVDDINRRGSGFQFSKDLVLKTGLMLADIPSVAFRVSNFNARNMAILEANWNGIAQALRLAVEVLASFGFSRQALSADSVVIPVAYYLYKRGLNESYLTSDAYVKDRVVLRGWICRSLVKAGVWGSGLDSLLSDLRATLSSNVASGYPLDAVETAMAKRGKALRFTEDEVQDLLDTAYGNRRTFALLALLYPSVDFTSIFHIDHIFPRSRFTAAQQRKAGVPEEKIGAFHDKANRLPNLQLLSGPVNIGKRDKMPTDWMSGHFPDDGARQAYCEVHDLGKVPETIQKFDSFYEARRERLATRLMKVLVLTTEDNGEANGVDSADPLAK